MSLLAIAGHILSDLADRAWNRLWFGPRFEVPADKTPTTASPQASTPSPAADHVGERPPLTSAPGSVPASYEGPGAGREAIAWPTADTWPCARCGRDIPMSLIAHACKPDIPDDVA